MGTSHRTIPQVNLLKNVLAVPLLFLIGCGQNSASPSAVSDAHPRIQNDSADLHMEKMKVQSYDTRGLAWEMESPFTRAFTSKHKIIADDIHVRLFEEGKPSTQIEADKGTLNSNNSPTSSNDPVQEKESGTFLASGDMYLKGHVVVTSTDGARILTDWAHYKRNQGLIVSTAPVQVIREDSITRGVGLEATSTLSHVKIFHQTLIIKDKSNGKTP